MNSYISNLKKHRLHKRLGVRLWSTAGCVSQSRFRRRKSDDFMPCNSDKQTDFAASLQEIVWCPASHVGLASSRCRVKLQAETYTCIFIQNAALRSDVQDRKSQKICGRNIRQSSKFSTEVYKLYHLPVCTLMFLQLEKLPALNKLHFVANFCYRAENVSTQQDDDKLLTCRIRGQLNIISELLNVP